MKITHTLTSSASTIDKLQESTTSPSTSSASDSSSAAKSDRLQLSTLTSHLSASPTHSAQRSAAVAKLSAAVSSGQYQVDARLVSHKLIEEHLAA
jgi:flagellar biosynthesis anti-sigma factor FlgM